MKEGILGIKEVADYLKMRQQTVYRLSVNKEECSNREYQCHLKIF